MKLYQYKLGSEFSWGWSWSTFKNIICQEMFIVCLFTSYVGSCKDKRHTAQVSFSEQTTSLTIDPSFKLQKVIPSADPYFRFPFLLSIFLARFLWQTLLQHQFSMFYKGRWNLLNNCGGCFRNCIYIFLQNLH